MVADRTKVESSRADRIAINFLLGMGSAIVQLIVLQYALIRDSNGFYNPLQPAPLLVGFVLIFGLIRRIRNKMGRRQIIAYIGISNASIFLLFVVIAMIVER
jgi:hypothetical protein